MSEYRIPNVNYVIISGRTTSDPVLSYTEKGVAYLRFRIASNRNFRSKDGEWQEETTFVGITLWGDQAERLSEVIKKGVPVLIEGRLSSYTREVEGFKRTEVSVRAFRVQVLLKTGTPYLEGEAEAEEEKIEEATSEEEVLPPDEEELPF
ncbi:MAG: single-stranded DNA-binding protein [candidate division WOR-3 bacterium]